MEDRERIHQMLQSQQEEERLQGLKCVGRCGAEFDLGLVCRALGDESWRVRKEAVELFLSTPRAGELAGEVIEFLHAHDNAGLRNAAVEILVRLGSQAVPFLLEEISCNDHDVRKFVLDILGEIGDQSCIEAMIGSLIDADENVRAAAAENLGKLRAAESVPALLDTLDRADLLMRFTILEALAKIGEPLPVSRLLHLAGERLLRKALFDCLGVVGGMEAVPLLAEGLTDSMRNVRDAAIVALDRIAASSPEPIEKPLRALAGTPAAEAVAAALDSPDSFVCRGAVRLLRLIQDHRFARRLLGLFENEMLREEAAATLVAMGHAAACSLKELWPDADGRTRTYLAYIFGESSCKEGLDLLLGALDEEEIDLKLVSAQALGKLGESDAISPLANALLDSSSDVRETAMQALCRLGDTHREETCRTLAPLLDEEDPELRMHIVSILGHMNGDEVRARLAFAMKDESPLVRRAAVRALEGKTGDAELPALMLALTDEDAEVRRLAVDSLCMTGDRQAIQPLELALKDEDIWVRAAAVRALGRLGGKESFGQVSRALRDPVGLIAITALETLSSLDAGRAQTAMVQSLGHEDEEVVNAALNLLIAGGCSDWIRGAADSLLNHHHWEVRSTFIRALAALEGTRCRQLLEERLLIEGEELVRQLIQDLLAQLTDNRG